MLKILQDGKHFIRLQTSKLAAANVRERDDLEECIFNSWGQFCDELGEKLHLVNKEVNVRGNRIDVLAFDSEGNAVVIELKRGSDKLQLLQALSYASMISSWTLEEFLDKAPSQDRADDLREALALETTESEINGSQRILLIAEEFDYEVLVTAEWLYGKEVDLSCFRVSLACEDDSKYLALSQIFPTPELADLARKKGRIAGAARPAPSSWGEALSDVTNDAVIEFFERKSKLNITQKLRYRELDFPPDDRVHVHVRPRYAAVEQWCCRFPGDIEFWKSKVNPQSGIQVGTKAHPNDVLRFRLYTNEDFRAFEEALKNDKLLRATWTNKAEELPVVDAPA